MPIRLTAEHRDVTGTARKIDIYDRDLGEYLGSKLLCTSDFYVLKHEGDINDPFKRIIPCNCQFTIFLAHPNYTPEEEAEVNLFFSDLISSHEGRFYVRCQYNDSSEYEFYGKILPDIGELTLDLWQTVQITAIDGISGLRDVEYRPTAYSDTDPEDAVLVTKFKDHFVDIIKRNDVVEFFQDEIAAFNTSMITTSAFWTESQSIAGDIFNQVKVRNIWFEKVSETYRKYQSCYEALEQLLTGFVARCVYASGKYHIEQLPYQDNLTLVRYGYKYNGDPMAGTTYGNKTTINYTTDDNIRALTYPSKRWLAPLKAIELTHSKQFTNYMNGMDVTATKTGWGGSGTLNFGDVIGQGYKLVTQFNIEIARSGAFTALPYLAVRTNEFVLKFKLKIEDYYARIQNTSQYLNMYPQGQFQVQGTSGIPILEWSLTDSTIELRWNKTIVSTSLTDYQNQMTNWLLSIKNSDLVLETNEIQADGDLIWELGEFLAYSNGTEIGGTPPSSMSFRRTSRIIIASGYSDLYEQPKSIKKYEVGDVRNTLIYKLDMRYFDSAKLHFEQLFIINATTVKNVPTVEWTDADAALTLPIQDLMMKTMLAMRQYPAEVFKMEFIFMEPTIFRMDNRVAIDGQLYIPLDLEIFSGTGVYRVSLMKVYKDFTGVNIIDIGEQEPDSPFPMPDGGLDANYPPTGGLKHFEEWTNVAVNYVEIENLAAYVNVNDEYYMKTKFHVIVNGVRQRYVSGTAPTPNIQNREFDVDTATDRVYIGKGSVNIKHVEILIYY